MRGVPVLCVLVLALAGSSAAQTRVAFLAAGDYGVGGSRELALGLRMKSFESRNPANMLVVLGDNDYTESARRFRANWSRSFGWARPSGLRVAGVLGNHDYELNRGRYQFRLLGMPGPYYTRRLGDAQLFFLDSNLVSDRQTAWLEQELAESTSTWRIAVLHHPPYTCGGPFRRLERPAALGSALRGLRRPARPVGARPQLPAVCGPRRRHVRRPRRRRRGPLQAARLSLLVPAAGPDALRARLPLGLGRPGRPRSESSRPPRPGATASR